MHNKTFTKLKGSIITNEWLIYWDKKYIDLWQLSVEVDYLANWCVNCAQLMCMNLK